MTMPNVPLFRILDANLDRAREGLRVVEEWCRFGLDDPALAALCKQLRQELGRWHRSEFRAARDTPGDVGTDLTHAREQVRADIPAVLQANLCRVQEALRVLEEYGKVCDPAMGTACKRMRYQTYTLESKLLLSNRRHKLQQAKLCLVTMEIDALNETVAAALEGGVRLVQYRDKDSDDPIRFERAKMLRSLCHQYQALFIVNDRVDLALAVEADGVHLGQQDLPVAAARRLLGSDRIIGRSTTNPEELARAMQEGVDYVGVGPVCATPTKPDKAVAGLDYVRYAAAHSTLPWFAIGGIDGQNLSEVMAAGAERVAVVRAIMKAADPAQAARQIIAQLEGAPLMHPTPDVA
ncbi:thiamine phosphate synthase [Altericista sp. CCNU0014]|uniref:thiamine phosphate synthase n=1 Tax=Altericista sp. CCNU0014 TaxID=3082949 RepID=UPI00384F9FBF